MSRTYRAARLITGTVTGTGDRDAEARPGWVRVEDDRVVAVGAGAPDDVPSDGPSDEPSDGPGDEQVDLGGVTLVPGFVDMHVHGAGGATFAEDADAARVVAATHLAHGTTSLMASLVTDSMDRLEQQVRALAPLAAAGDLLGTHLEGPWLSDRHPGAHDPSLLQDPTPADVERLLAAGGDTVAMATLAPERAGGLDAVRRLVAAGVVVGVGHSDATYAETRAAIDAGARVATHLYNAARRPDHREPGLVVALLEAAEVTVELIADGVHVHEAVLRRTLREAGRRTALVTDAMAATGRDDGEYRLGPLDVRVRDGVARVVTGDGSTGRIAGSTLTLDRAVRRAVDELGLTLPQAVHAAATAPADALGRTDLGRIAPGARADLVALDADLRVVAVVRGGERVV